MGDNENNVEIGNDIQLNIDNQKESKVIINNKIKTNENNPLKEIPYSELENDEDNIKESQEQLTENIRAKINNIKGKYYFRKVGNCHFFFWRRRWKSFIYNRTTMVYVFIFNNISKCSSNIFFIFILVNKWNNI